MAASPHQPSTFLLSYRQAVALCYLLVFLGAGALWLRDQRTLEHEARQLAREQGAMVVSLIQLVRQWNAEHDGVWVRTDRHTPPNPYLEHPQRDLVTTDGMHLTMVNPAYMTRQLAEMAASMGGSQRLPLQFHLTSLNPIRPANAADSWEQESLRLFDTGSEDRLSYFDTDAADAGVPVTTPVYRYMAPLRVNEACMSCHAKQGYKVGDVRGGISVTLEANELREMVTVRQRSNSLGWVAMALLLGALLHALAWRLYQYAGTMRRIQRDQERLIAERTQALSASEARYRSVFDTASEAIMVLDAQGRITQVNPAFVRITGYAPAEATGQAASFMHAGHHEQPYFADIETALDAQGCWEGDVWLRRKDGSLLVAWQSLTRLPGAAAAAETDAGPGASGGVVVTFFDITARKTEEDAARHRAQHDLLTELPNRSLFLDRLHKLLSLAQRHQRKFALLYFDLDKFKEANDSLGHAAGDAVLQQTAQRALRCVRAADTVARFGGDEFAVLLSEFENESDVREIAQRLVDALAEPFFLSEGRVEISVSIGIALYPAHGDDEATLQQRADKALYAVKRGGRNGYALWTPAIG